MELHSMKVISQRCAITDTLVAVLCGLLIRFWCSPLAFHWPANDADASAPGLRLPSCLYGWEGAASHVYLYFASQLEELVTRQQT